MAVCPTYDPKTGLPLPPELPVLNFLGTGTCTPHYVSRMTGAPEGCSGGFLFPLTFEALKTGVPEGSGNIWWQKRIKATEPAAKQALMIAALISKQHFAYYFGPGREHSNMLMRDVLVRYDNKLVPTLGTLKTPVPINPTEKAGDYVKRGGFLYWIGGWPDSGGGVFGRDDQRPPDVTKTTRPYTGKTTPPSRSIQTMTLTPSKLGAKPGPWLFYTAAPRGGVLPKDIEGISLSIMYEWTKGDVILLVHLTHKGTFDKAMDSIRNAGAWLATKTCAALTNETLQMVGAMAATSPQGAAAVATWQQAASLCGKTIPVCSPPPTPAFPPGSIAYFDTAAGGYMIATPKTELAGLQPTHVEVGIQPALPAGVALVDSFVFQNATRVWYHRTWVQIAGGGGLAALLLGIVVVKARRSKNA